MAWKTKRTLTGAKLRTSATKKTSGIGSAVSETTLINFANAWITAEEKNPSRKPYAINVAKSMGLSVAPEWIDSDRYLKILEVVRFERKVKVLAARPEISNLISELVGLGLLEAQRRLMLSPQDIPATVIFGDILHKWPKMLHDFSADKPTQQVGDVFKILNLEINMIADPVVREQMRQSIMGELTRAATELQSVTLDALALNAAPEEVVDAEGSSVLMGRSEPHVGGPAESDVAGELEVPARNLLDDPRLWDDPALD